jgi:hypothetical protein
MCNTSEDAKLMIAEVEAALARGTKHYTKDGKPLRTVFEVIEAITRDDEIVFESPRNRTTAAVTAQLPATPETVAQAKAFLLRKWRERAMERGDSEPVDLSRACKFVSMFAQRVFGGELRGNWHHQYLVLPTGERLDLTEPSEELASISSEGIDPYWHDKRFWGNRDHKSSMASCEPRVLQWVEEFLRQYPKS